MQAFISEMISEMRLFQAVLKLHRYLVNHVDILSNRNWKNRRCWDTHFEWGLLDLGRHIVSSPPPPLFLQGGPKYFTFLFFWGGAEDSQLESLLSQ